jgi:hypothetical protein
MYEFVSLVVKVTEVLQKYNLIMEKLAEKSAKRCEFKHSTPKARKFSGETIYTFTKPLSVSTFCPLYYTTSI